MNYWGISYLILLAAASLFCAGLAVKLIRRDKQGCAIVVMLLGPFCLASLIWLVHFIVALFLWSNGL